jgi:hypothetical protein
MTYAVAVSEQAPEVQVQAPDTVSEPVDSVNELIRVRAPAAIEVPVVAVALLIVSKPEPLTAPVN